MPILELLKADGDASGSPIRERVLERVGHQLAEQQSKWRCVVAVFRRAVGFFGTSYAALASQGIEVFHADYREIPLAFTSGAVDYVFGATSAPGAPITALFHRPGGSVLLPLDSDLLEHLHLDYGVATGTIAAGTYPGASEPIATAVMETIFIVSAKAPPDLIDRVTSVLLDHQGELRNVHPSLVAFDPSRAITKSMLPLHDGAVRAYERRGFHI